KFDRGVLAMASGDPPGKERVLAAWVIGEPGKGRGLQGKWRIPGYAHDWFNVHTYNTFVETSPGNAPPGEASLMGGIGDADNKNTSDQGETFFLLDAVNDTSWSVIVEGCDPSYGFFGIRTGHTCRADVLPRITVNIAVPPRQSFSCDAHLDHEQGIVMEVGGSCSRSPYGLFVYVWSKPCSLHEECPERPNDFGFVVVALSRGWTWRDFGDMVFASIATANGGKNFHPTGPPSQVLVPISPPVILQGDHWVASGVPSSHIITFHWRALKGSDSIILG